jgi:type II secretory pathway component PulC
VPEEPPHETEPLPNLTGIIRGEGKLLAVINNNIVEEGQTIGGMRVKKIYNDHVVLSDNAKEYIITLK